MRTSMVGLAVLGLVLSSGCTRSRTPSRDGSVVRLDGATPDGGRDAGPPPCPVDVDEVDLLLMVDNSNSMSEEQTSLAVQFPRLVRVLATGDLDGDGVEDFVPVRSLQVGVVSSDMGTGGHRVPTCSEPGFGDDGVLRTTGNTMITGCLATYPPFLGFRPADGADPDAFAADVSCVATIGTGGCGFEQQLEAVLKATTPSTSSIAFHMDTSGHADRENMGFLRPDSLLAVVLVTDEEDCSAADPELFSPSSSVYTGELNLRCFNFPVAVHPVARYVEGLVATRTSPDLLLYAAIAGVPPRLVEGREVVDFNAILTDPEMQEMIDPTLPTRLRPSCNVPGRGLAFPPRRMVQVGREIEARGGNAVVQSICQADFSPAVDAILGRIARRLRNDCRR